MMNTESVTNKPVSLPKRLMAILYDALLMLALLFIVGIVIASVFTFSVNQGNAITPEHPIYTIYQLVILLTLFTTAFLFLGWFWTHGGQTLGMRTWKLKLVSNNDQPISWSQAFIRYCAALLSWGTCGAGFLWALFNKDRKTWHDLLSGSSIIQLNQTKTN